MTVKRSVTIVGGGQSGLQLALGLLQDGGYDVRVVQNRTAEEIAAGRVTSSQCMFDQALENERALGINFWEDDCPTVDSINFTVPAPDAPGVKAIDWNGKLVRYGQSVDQRVKFPGWMKAVEDRGGTIEIHEASVEDLERYARESDLVVVAAGKGEIAGMFTRDEEKSAFDKPQRALALTYVTGMVPRPEHSAVCFNLIPTVGEYFVFPALTTTGPCEIMVFEGIPGGPMDCWGDVKSPDAHLAKSKWILETFLPWEAERCREIALTDDNGVLSGRFPPTVRHPVGRLPSGRAVLGMGDVVVLNDPITGQGSNNASKCARVYMDAILSRGDQAYDEAWMQATFDTYWAYAQYVAGWTNALLTPPPPHVLQILGAAQQFPTLARRIANGFDDPTDFFPWFAVPDEADAYLKQLAA